jgi:hypothetical protein
MEPPQIKAGEEVQFPVLLQKELRLPFTQELERRPKPVLGPQGAFRDDTLHPVVTGGEPDDLGGLAVSEAGKHDGRSGKQGHKGM